MGRRLSVPSGHERRLRHRFRRDGRRSQAAQRRDRPAVARHPIIVGELRFGLRKRRSTWLARRVEGVLARLDVEPLGPEVADRYAATRLVLERAGTPIGHNDLWIAAHALTLGATLVTANEQEFRRVAKLNVENWLAE